VVHILCGSFWRLVALVESFMTSLPQLLTWKREKSVDKKPSEQSHADRMVPDGLYEVRAIQLPGGSWRHYYVDHASKSTYWILPYLHPDGLRHSLEQEVDYLPSYEECVKETSPLAVPNISSSRSSLEDEQ
jgi:hypothetical protein